MQLLPSTSKTLVKTDKKALGPFNEYTKFFLFASQVATTPRKALHVSGLHAQKKTELIFV